MDHIVIKEIDGLCPSFMANVGIFQKRQGIFILVF